METGNTYIQTFITMVSLVHTFAEQFLPTIVTIRSCRISGIFRSGRMQSVHLVTFRIDTGRRRVENSSCIPFISHIHHMDVTHYRIMHNIGIILTGKNKTGTPHIGSKLIDFVKLTIDGTVTYIHVAQVTDNKIIGFRR